MNITLSPETEKLLQDKLNSGAYRSADDVVHAALEALNEIEAIGLDEATLDAIDQAEDQIELGKAHDWEEVREEVRAKFLGK
jgi:putative addiction module CopG family antidote